MTTGVTYYYIVIIIHYLLLLYIIILLLLYYIILYIVVSWTKGLRYRPNRKQCRESRGIVGYINVYINVSSPFQVNSFVEKACVTLATGVFGTRAR